MADEAFQGSISFPAHTRSVRTSEAALTKLVESVAPGFERFAAEGIEPYFWAAEISSDRVDSYFSFMDESSLKNYATDAEEGVAFMTSHDTRKLPLGRSLTGKYSKAKGAAAATVEAEFYTAPNLNLNGVSTDEFMRGIDFGIINDVSIGFHGGEWMCNICNRDMMDWSDWDNMCWHIPGISYEMMDESGTKTGKFQMCLARITNAGLSEVSAVFDGATPGASIRQAMHVAEAGHLPAVMAQKIEAHYQNRFKIPGAHQRIHAIGELPTGKEDRMSDTKNKKPIAEAVDEDRSEEVVAAEVAVNTETEVETPVNDGGGDDERAVEAEAVETPEGVEAAAVEATEEAPEPITEDAPVEVRSEEEAAQVEVPANAAVTEPQGDADDMALREVLRSVVADAAVGEFEDPMEGVRKMASELERLRPLADMGRTYRSDLIDETIDEGIRAHGNAFPVEARRSMLNKLDIPEIKSLLNEYRGKSEEVYGGERETPEGEGDGEPEVKIEKPLNRNPGNQNISTVGLGRGNLPIGAVSNV